MEQDRIDGRELRRAALRLRLAGLALGVTLLILSPRSDQTAAGAVLIGYAAAVTIQRFTRTRLAALPAIAVVLDVLYAAGISYLLPLSAGSWALYALAIGTAALGYGAMGAAAATAAAIVGYDVVIAAHSEELRPSDLWPVQLLLAVGLLVAELVWAARRGTASRRRLRAYALAQRDLIAARDEHALLDRLTDHAVRSFDAAAAWIETAPGSPIGHARGAGVPADRGATVAWPISADTTLRCAFAGAADEETRALMRDLVTDAAPLLAAARERSRLAHAKAALDRTLAGVRALERDRVTNAVLAEVLSVANEIAGSAAVVRLADGTVVAGDLEPGAAIGLARDSTLPSLVADGAVVGAGPGLALVAVGRHGPLTPDDLHALIVLGEIANAAVARIAERDELIARADALGRRVAELNEQARARDDAVASAVHELRTPLTSVHAFAQLTSRNLQAVQQQVKQLDRIIADLLHAPGSEGAGLQLEDVDLLVEAKQAGRRAALVSGRRVDVNAAGTGPFVVQADRSRVEQVIDNLLNNAVKFSPADSDVDVELDRGEHEVVFSVTDAGAGIAASELDRVFQRYYRGADQRGVVPGEGIGLAIAREIVVMHGGRIWAASEGPGKGSTFFVALPVVAPESRRRLESSDVAGARAEAAHQA